MTREGLELNERTGMEIAIVGMAGRFPGADTVLEFWDNVRRGVESFQQVSAADLEAAGQPASLLKSPGYVPVVRPISDFDRFDAGFFGISAREAEIIDPQHRIFLECAWEALEDAGYDPARIRGQVGVYAGSRMNAYLLNVSSQAGIWAQAGELGIQLGNDKDYLAARVSYKLDLGGPSVTVQSACSTALLGIHLACQALIAGECDMALAGGVAVRFPLVGYPFLDGGVQSPDGRVRAFDARARGTMFSSGMGVVAFKRLEEALTDGDTIHAVVKGSAASNDGADKVGFAAPGVEGQVRAVRSALLAAEVDPGTVGFIEAHGTGTPMGDPIEVEALTRVFRESTAERGFCALGSVKSNIGHAGTAAGVAGLIKAALALEHREIPPTLHFDTPNPQIDFEASPFFVNRESIPWPANGGPRRAGVSSFGMGGTNVHVVLEEAPAQEPSGPSRPWQLLVLSARSPSALEGAGGRLGRHFESGPEVALADAAFTLRVGRRAFDHRRAVVCRGAEDAVAALRGELPERAAAGTATGQPPVAFLFSGQGAQYPGMGRGLYECEEVFRAAIDRCDELLAPHLEAAGEPRLLELLYPAGGTDEGAAERLARTSCTQPALFAVEYAAAELWRSWGVRPHAMIGHSVGEYVAACQAGVLSLEDALGLVAARGRLMQSLPPGSMLAVPLAEPELTGLLGPQLSLAAVNAPERCVVSGPSEAIEAFRETLASRGVECRPLHTSHAFHSPMMEPILAPFADLLGGLRLQAPEVPFVSNLTGTWITADEATDPGYWARHLRQPVRFADGLSTLLEADPGTALLEVGPGNTLATLARRHPSRRTEAPVASSLPHPKQGGDDLAHLLHAMGVLWCHGVAVDWQAFHQGETRRRVPLPTYPFERQRYWLDVAEGAGLKKPLMKRPDPGNWYHLPCWRPSGAPAPTAGGGPDTEAGTGATWLVFDDPASEVGSALAAALGRRLAQAGHRAVSVGRGDAFRRLDDERYEVGAGRADYEALLEDLALRELVPQRVAHLWCASYDAAGDELADDALERGFWSLLHLSQGLGKKAARATLRIAVASAGMHRIADEDAPAAAVAALLGPCRVVPQEQPGIRCASLDLAAGADADAAAEALVAEVEAGLPDDVVAFRGGSRWVRDFGPAYLPAPEPARTRLREGGVYLITGGLGGFGLTFAEHLASGYGAKLILIGRSDLPAAPEWDAWLAAHDEDDRTSRKIRSLRALEASGAEVVAETADVADPAAVSGVVARARERFGRIDGVIHAAGVPGGGMVQLKTREAAAAVLAPKVRGTLALERALDGVELDFLMLCSSTLSVLGTFGQVDYAGANAFLDAYAHAARRDGRYTVSVNWCAWGEVGMAVETKLPAGLVAAGVPAIPPPPEHPVHPLLDRRIEDGDTHRVFSTWFTPERHWVLNDHRIVGAPTVPGTTWIEMARAAFEDLAGPGPMEVRDLLFFTPVVVHDGDAREVRVTVDGGADGADFRVESHVPKPGGGERVQLHAQGRLLRSEAGAGQTGVQALLARLDRREAPALDGSRESVGDRLVYWGPRWQCLQAVWAGDDEGVAELELPEEFVADVDTLGLHPTLLDVGTAIGAVALEKETYLPLSYKQVRVSGALPARVYSHLRKTGGGRGAETIRFDVTFFDADGRELIAIEGFSLKRAGEAGRRLAEKGAAAPAASAVAASPDSDAPAPVSEAAPAGQDTLFGADGITSDQGADVLERVLCWGRQPQVVVNPRDFIELMARARAVDLAAMRDRAGAGGAPRGERPELATDFVEPRTEVEARLVAIWSRTLSLESIGVHDNFFDLGGDSIVAINLVASMAKEGFDLSPDQLFERQTIAQLAEVLGEPAAERDPETVWSAWLEEQSAGAWSDGLAYWLAEERLGGLTLATEGGNGAGGRGALTVRLEAAASRELSDRVLPDLRASLEEVSLAALAAVLSRRAGNPRLLVRLLGDGRASAPADLDLARSDRPLPYSFPLLVELSGLEEAAPAELVRAVKEQRRSVPGGGAAFAGLRCYGDAVTVRPRLEAMPLPTVGLTVGAAQPPPDDPLGEPALELRVDPAAEGLALAWSFEEAAVERGFVAAVADDVAELLRDLTREDGSLAAEAVSPSDFPEADLSAEDLAAVLTQLKGGG